MNTRDEVRQMRIREWKKVFEDKAPSTYLPLLMPWSEDLPDSCRNTLKS